MALFCSDVDGTLLDAHRRLSSRTIAAIRAVREAGHTFVLGSARMPASLRLLEREYAGDGSPLIAYNGALVISAEGRVGADIRLPAEVAHRITGFCVEAELHASFFDENDWFAWADDRWTAREIDHTGIEPSRPTARDYIHSGRVDASPPHKVMCMGDPQQIAALQRQLEGDPDVVAYRSSDTYLEIANAGCSKGRGLDSVARELNTDPAETYYFGDNHNDLSAFTVAGTAVAVANARPEVRAAATVITAANSEDGVAQFLEAWLDGRSR